MTRTHALIALAVLAVIFGGWRSRDASYARAESRRLASVVDSLVKVRSRVDTVHAVTVRNVVRQVTRLDTLTQTVELWKSDTIRVVEYVTRADSLARACTALIDSCDEKVRVRDALLATRERQWAADKAVLQAKVPSRLDRLRGAALWLSAGYLAGRVSP